MRLPRFSLNNPFLLGMAQAFDLSGTLTSPRLREIGMRTPGEALARDRENLARDLDRVLQRYVPAHGQ